MSFPQTKTQKLGNFMQICQPQKVFEASRVSGGKNQAGSRESGGENRERRHAKTRKLDEKQFNVNHISE
jgi:hypothetical protein